MNKFKIGDKVRGNTLASQYNVTTPLTEWCVEEISDGQIRIGGFWVSSECFDLITNTNKMNIIDKIKLARMNEPEKTLVKAELMNLDGSLTTEGKEALNDILVQAYKEQMKTEYALPIIEDKEKNKQA
jgi:hypothetical protein